MGATMGMAEMFRWAKICLFVILAASAFVEAFSKKRVCVIGAGMAGLASVRQLSEHPDEIEPIVFERNSDVGGLWIYTDSSDVDEHGLPVHSSAYKNLRTNIPKEIMAYPDYRQFEGRENRSHVSHKMVLEYLRNFTDHFDLRQYIKLDTLVVGVKPVVNGDLQSSQWRVRTRNLNIQDETEDETICDYIMVCNGHFSTPRIPQIQNIKSFPGRVLHSHAYRRPDEFADQKVLILGASTSGIDIAVDLSRRAKVVYLSHRYEKMSVELPTNVIQVRGVVATNGDKLILQDSSSVTVDAMIYCTGYLHDFPFLDKSSGIQVDDNYVYPLYQHIVNIESPSMAFIGLPYTAVNGALYYTQAKYFTAFIRHIFQLPSKAVMLKNAKRNPGTPKRMAHLLGDTQWIYYDNLARQAEFEALPKFYRDAEKATLSLIIEHSKDHKEYDLRQLLDGTVVFVRDN